jgi:UDP-N-acetyl-2-amino-2-deoxyglucuronate dehydrogenase
MKTYCFAIVGCGMISEYHAAAIADLPQAKLVAVASRTEKNRRRLMEKYGCEGTADYRELAERKEIDVVCVCTPSGAHLEPAETFARAGKHVIVEKPIEVTLARADAVIRACDENHVRLCTIFPYRFTEGAIALKAAIAQGRFGRITVGDAYNKWWRAQSYYDSGAWRGTMKLDGGGACMNQGIHAIDLLVWLVGPIKTVWARAAMLAHQRIEVEDVAVATVEFEGGALCERRSLARS